jgi:hypothetical protein
MKLDSMVQLALDAATNLLPDFRPSAEQVRQSIKCVVLPGWLGERAVVVKKVVAPEPLWSWYLHREAELYQRFRTTPPPVAAPALIAADTSRQVMVLERAPGEPIAFKRHDVQKLDRPTCEALLAARRSIADWSAGLELAPRSAPDAASVAMMRSRLLEDPSAPLQWFTEGIARSATLKLISDEHAQMLEAALVAHPTIRFAHGDLLLRNVIRADDGKLTLIDWECAGAHPEGWDAALLWVWMPEWARQSLRDDFEREGEGAACAFLACVAFALLRELKFRSSRSKRDVVIERLNKDLNRVLSELARMNKPRRTRKHLTVRS